MLYKSVMSLMATAADSRRVNFMVAIDPDEEHIRLSFPSAATVGIWSAPERFGYPRLHEYYNALAERADGRWLMLWNDDAFMLTKGWDAVISSQPLCWMLKPWHSDGGYSHNDFPVWPKWWTDHLGYVSPTRCTDAYIAGVSEMMNLVREIPVQIQHDRDPAMISAHSGTSAPGDLDHPEMIARRREDASRLYAHIIRQYEGKHGWRSSP